LEATVSLAPTDIRSGARRAVGLAAMMFPPTDYVIISTQDYDRT